MKKKMTTVVVAAAMIGCLAVGNEAQALPTFQTYINGATAGTVGDDEDTWFGNTNPFDLYVVGAYGPNTQSLTNVTLLISVLQGEQGTISISGGPGLLSSITAVSYGGNNPNANADLDILTNVAGNDGYATKSFLPDDINATNHYPLQNDVSDFLLFDLGTFGNSTIGLNNYNADGTGSISFVDDAKGEQKIYSISSTGFTRLHFDVYGLEDTTTGKKVRYSWEINPGSHDSTNTPPSSVPEPGTLLLLGSGLLGLAGFARRNRK